MKIYVATKISGLPWDEVLTKLNRAKNYLEVLGYEVIIPTDFIDDANMPWKQAMRIVISELLKCDAIVMLPDWVHSRGAKIEHNLALEIEMPIFRLFEDIDGYVLRLHSTNIIEAVEQVFNLKLDESNKSRKGDLIDARRIIVRIMKDRNKERNNELVKILKKDNATIIHYNKTSQNLIDSKDKPFLNKYNQVLALI